jgi:MFS family permease
LNVARAVQGVGAALQLSAALAILSHSFQGPDRARAFSFWGSVVGIAITLGPIAGGVITQIFGWQWAFYINLPVGVGLIVLTAKSVRESRDPHSRDIDLAGVASFSLFLFLLTLALISGNRLGWTDRQIVIELLAAAAAFVVFLVVEARHPRPMLDLGFFRHRTYVGATIVSLAFSMSFLTMVTYVPMYFQGGYAATPIEAGLLMLPMAVPVFVVPRLISAHFAHRASDRGLLATGSALVALGLFGMALVATRMNYPAMLAAMFVSGCGAGIVNGEVARVSMTVIPPARAGMASGIGGTVRFTGIVIGFAVLAAILFQRIASAIARAATASPALDGTQLAHQIAAGKLQGQPGSALFDLSRTAFAEGYQALFLAAGLFAASAAALAWWLIKTNHHVPTEP